MDSDFPDVAAVCTDGSLMGDSGGATAVHRGDPPPGTISAPYPALLIASEWPWASPSGTVPLVVLTDSLASLACVASHRLQLRLLANCLYPGLLRPSGSL